MTSLSKDLTNAVTGASRRIRRETAVRRKFALTGPSAAAIVNRTFAQTMRIHLVSQTPYSAWTAARPRPRPSEVLFVDLNAHTGPNMKHQSTTFPVTYITATVDGHDVFFRQAGDPNKPTFVLLHGFPSSSHMYRDLIPLLVNHYHVIAPDYIGFGHSSAPSTEDFDYTFANLTAVVERLLSALGVEKYYLYMQDYGGPIGFRIAAKNPERVLGLVVQNANAYIEGVGESVANVFVPLWERGDETGARQMLNAETTRYQYVAGARSPNSLNPDAWTHDQALLDRVGSAERHMALFKDYQTNVASYDAWHAYFRAHQPPTLVVWGQGDPFFTVAGAQAFKQDLKNVEVILLDSGHFALEEDASTVAHHIARFF